MEYVASRYFKHKGERVRFYDYADAATLLEDFWKDVEAVLQERRGKL